MTTMIDAKGAEYIDKWLASTCARSDLALYEVVPVIERVTGATIAMPADTLHPDREALVAAVGGMEPTTAKQAVAEAKAEGLRRYPHGRCHSCGSALNSRRRCDERC